MIMIMIRIILIIAILLVIVIKMLKTTVISILMIRIRIRTLIRIVVMILIIIIVITVKTRKGIILITIMGTVLKAMSIVEVNTKPDSLQLRVPGRRKVPPPEGLQLLRGLRAESSRPLSPNQRQLQWGLVQRTSKDLRFRKDFFSFV